MEKKTRPLTRKELKIVQREFNVIIYGWQIPIRRMSEIWHAAETAYLNQLPIGPAVTAALQHVGAVRS